MNRSALLFAVVALMLGVLPCSAQIYADFTVSHGGTSLGTFRAQLDYDKAPRTCANFIGLATGQRAWIDVTNGNVRTNTPFYDGLTFHRLIHNFMIQGGSPNGQGTDGPGYTIMEEFHPDLRHSGRYILSMAKTGAPNTTGAQFFITLVATSHLDDKHSVFGEVIDGKDIIDGFTNATVFPTYADPINNIYDRPVTPIVMDSVVISGPSLAGFDVDDPALLLPTVYGQSAVPSYNPAAGAYTVNFDRQFQQDYLYFYSFDLLAWTKFGNIVSLNAESQYDLTVTGVTFKKFFSRLAAVDYSSWYNPSADLMSDGASLILSDRSGNSLTLVSDGVGGGAWSDSSGASGSLTSLTVTDLRLATGAIFFTSSGASEIPRLKLDVGLDNSSPALGRSAFGVYLSFYTPISGRTVNYSTNPAAPALTYEFNYTSP